MATATIEATGVGSTSQWTLGAGASKWVAVNSPDDDATSYLDSSTTINQVQQFTGDTSGIPTGSTVSQVDITYRVKRNGANNAQFTVGYVFNTDSGTQTGTSGALTSTVSWAGGTYTHSGLSAYFNGSLIWNIQNTQARAVQVSTLYVVITYTAPAGQPMVARARLVPGMRVPHGNTGW